MILGIFAVGVRLSLKWEPVLNFTRRTLQKQIQKTLPAKAEFRIGKLSGDLAGSISLQKLSLSYENTQIATLDNLSANYSLWDQLNGPYRVTSLALERPVITLDSTENGKLHWIELYQSLAESSIDSTAATAPPIELAINQWAFNDGKILINAIPDIPLAGLKLPFSVTDLNLKGRHLSYGAQPGGTLDNLEFRLRSEGGPAGWAVDADSALFEEKLTLEKLLLEGTRSYVSARGWYDTGTRQFEANLKGNADLASDIKPFFAHWPETPPFEASLHVSGRWPEFKLGVELQGDGLEHFDANGQFRFSESHLVIRRAGIELNGLSPGFTSQWLDTSYTPLSVSALSVDMQEGSLPFNGRLDEMKGQMSISARSMEAAGYRLDSLYHHIEKQRNAVKGTLTLLQSEAGRQGKIEMDLNAHRSDTALPFRWEMSGSVQNLDPTQWASSMPGETRINGTLSGDGQWTSPDNFRANYQIDLSNSMLQDQKFDRFSASGYLNEHNLSSSGELLLGNGVLSFSVRCEKYQQVPEYEFNINSRNLNLAQLNGLEDFPTDISGVITGYGKYFDPDQMQLLTDVDLDSSIINNEPIHRLSSRITIEDTTAIIEESKVMSTIVDGSFTGRMHLKRFYNMDNRINLDLSIKDLQPLAPLVDASVLKGKGKLKGSLIPEANEKMELEASLELNEVNYNDLLTVDQVAGRIHSMITGNPEFLAILNLQNPQINELVLKDFNITADGKVSNTGTASSQVAGNYSIRFEGTNNKSASASSKGTYTATEQQLQFHTTDLEVKGPQQTLTLQKPFDITVNENYSWSVDTLNVRSKTDQLKAACTYYNEHKQDIYVEANRLDLEVLQYTFLDSAYMTGNLNTRINYVCRPPYATGQSQLTISNFEFAGFTLDTLKSSLRIDEDQLNGSLSAILDGETLAAGSLDLPFRTGDPKNFPESYFRQAINGQLWAETKDLSKLQPLFEQLNISGLNGKGKMTMNLSGEIGEPQFEGAMRLTDVLLSGVYMDSLTANMEYRDRREELNFGGDIYSMEQKALEWSARLPFNMDFRDFSVDLPQAGDPIRADLTTRSFNLAILNNFMPPDQITGIQGMVDGQLSVSGTLERPEPSGQISLTKGRVNVVEGGVVLKNIETRTVIDTTGIKINRLHIENGKGYAEGNGLITLNGLQPDDIQLSLKARQFPLINTQNYRVVARYDGEINGTLTSPTVKGRMDIMSGYAYFNELGSETIEPVSVDSLDGMGSENLSMAIYDSLEMDVDLNFNRRFFVRTQRYIDSELELEGKLDLIKSSGSELEMFGSIETTGGYMRPLGKTFNHEEGVLRFEGDPTNPQLFVRTRFNSKQPEEDVIIWYIVEGRAQNPKFRYESKPEMDLKNIISYTLFGQPFYGLDSWKQSVAKLGGNRSAADMAVEVVLNRIERYATQRLGIDVVQINNSSNSGRTGTSVKTGWYLNEKVFFAIMNEISTRNLQFTLEYMLSDDWQLIMTQGEINPSGVDVQWQYDY